MASPTESPALAPRKRPHSSIDSTSTVEATDTAPIRVLLLHLNTLLSSTAAVAHTIRRTLAEVFPNPIKDDPNAKGSTAINKTEDKETPIPQQEHQQGHHHPHPDLTDVPDGAIARAFALSPSLPTILAHLGIHNLSADDITRLEDCYQRIYFTEGLSRIHLAPGAQTLLSAARLHREANSQEKKREVDDKTTVTWEDNAQAGVEIKEREMKKEEGDEKVVVAGEGVPVVVLTNNTAKAEEMLAEFGGRRLLDAVLPSHNTHATDSAESAPAWVQAVNTWFAQFCSTSNGADVKPLLPEQMLVVSRARYDLDIAKTAGAKTCWVRGDADCEEPGSPTEIDLEVEDLEELRGKLRWTRQ